MGPRNSKEWRAEQVAKRRAETQAKEAAVLALEQEHGPDLSPEAREQARALALHLWGATSWPLPCRVTLHDGTVLDPCLVLSPADRAMSQAFEHVSVGGQVRAIAPSDYTLPPKVLRAAFERKDYRMGAYYPLVVRLKAYSPMAQWLPFLPWKRPHGDLFLLVEAFAYFFEFGGYLGKDVDPDWFAEPSRAERAHNEFAAALADRTHVVVTSGF